VLSTCFKLVSYLAYIFTLKMEATYFSQTSVEFKQLTRFCIPEDRTVQLTDFFVLTEDKKLPATYHILACSYALSRLSEEPSFATTVQGICFIYILTATCFGPRWPSSGGTYNILRSYHSHNGSVVFCKRLIVHFSGKYCRRLLTYIFFIF
jgi:hypothetical protein